MKYDDLDYHSGAAEEAGQPTEHGFVHIGLYLGWLIRHDLNDPGHFAARDVQAVKAAEMTGSDLADDVDHRLASDMLAPEGAAFTDAYYETYLRDYEREFGGEPPYSIAHDAASYARIAPAIDRAYADWIAAGSRTAPARARAFEGSPPTSGAHPTSSATRSRQRAFQVGPLSSTPIEDLPKVHAAPTLERILVERLGIPANDVESATGSEFGSSRLNRVLRRLGVRGRDATVVFANQGWGQDTVSIALFAVPTIGAARLTIDFADVIHRPKGGRWTQASIGGQLVERAADAEFQVVYWATDGLVFEVSASSGTEIDSLVAQLGRSPA
jgi:hypothetical protein